MTSSELAILVAEWAQGGLSDEIDADASLEAVLGHKLAITSIRAHLKDADEYLVDLVKDGAIQKGGEVVDGYHIEVKWRPGTIKTDGEGLVKALVAQARDERQIDPDTGEVLEPPEAPVVRVLTECAPLLTDSFGWRSGALKKRFTPEELDEYQEFERDEFGNKKFYPYLKVKEAK